MLTQAEAVLLTSDPGPARESFTSLEWLVIAIGAQDESVPLRWSRFGRALLALMGEAPRPLFSPCLEKLRSTASVASRYGWAMPSADIGAFLLGGWSEAQLERIIESVCPHGPTMEPWQPVLDIDGGTPAVPPFEIRTVMEICA